MAIDLAGDLNAVFFADFNHTATINGQSVVGYLDLSPHQFMDVDAGRYVFHVPAAAVPVLTPRQTLMIEGVNYVFLSRQPAGDMLRLVVEPVTGSEIP